MPDVEWIKRWEEQHLSSSPEEDGEVANMDLTDYATMLAELEGK